MINIGLLTLDLSSEAMLQDGKVLGTHLARWNQSSWLWWPIFISHHSICYQLICMLNLMCMHVINLNSIYQAFHLDRKINFSECVWMVIFYIQGFERIIKQTSFSCFWCGFKIKMLCMNMWLTTKNIWRTHKNI